MYVKKFICYITIIICIISMAGCVYGGDKAYLPVLYPIGVTWESEAGSVTLTDYSLSDSYTLNDGSVIEAEDGHKLMVICFETQFHEGEGWYVLGHSPFGRAGSGSPTYYPVCGPIVWDDSKTVLLYSLPEDVATRADFSMYRLELTLVGGGSANETFGLHRRPVSE